MAFSYRKNPRLQSYDYDQNGVYFITFCTKNRASILCVLVGRDVGATAPVMELTGIGKVVDKYINLIPDYYKDTKVDKYVIMPNHVHLLLNIECGAGGGPGSSRPTDKDPRIAAALKRFTNINFV